MDSLDDLFDEILSTDEVASDRREAAPWEKDIAPVTRPKNGARTRGNEGRPTTAPNPHDAVPFDTGGKPSAINYTHSALKENSPVERHFFRPNDPSTTSGSRKTTLPAPVVEDNLSRETADLLAQVVGVQRLNDAWKQGFFCANFQPYGLQQVEGGPCGIIAAVQAYLLKHLFVNLDGRPFSQVLQCSAKERTEALIDALAEILWQAGGDRARILLPRTFGQVPLDATRFTDLRPVGFSSQEQLREGLASAYKEHFLSPSAGGVALFLYSIVYSRGLENTRRDFDEENGGMIGAHGYCTQELVNLCIFGRAYTNVFDGCKRLGTDKDGYVAMQGVPRKCSVGFLSLFEAFKVHEVGSRLKSPVAPIWIVVAESHYTVLFADANNYDTKKVGPCTLFYFDPLGRQSDLLQLTIEPDGIPSHLTGFEDDGSMIDRVIRTKWTRAAVDWNGKEPIL